MDEDDFCDCTEYTADTLEGRAHCYRCGRSWWMSTEQLERELRWQVEMFEQEADAASPEGA